MAPEWYLREVKRVLVDEDWGDGAFTLHKDITTVGDVLRIGAPALSIRFREVGIDVWQWLVDELEARR